MDQENLVVSPEEVGLRLDKILADRFASVKSRTYFQNLIENSCVFVNGSAVKKRYQPKAGDEIDVQFICTPELAISPENIPLDIIYEDASLLVINKPSGMVVHPAVGNWTGTFVNALLHHCGQPTLFGNDTVRPGIVHRLDKETTGLLIAAKNDLVQRHLIEQFSQRSVYKEYLAICFGNPGNLTIDQPIGRHPKDRKLMAVVPTGRRAISQCQTIAFNGELSLVNIVLVTGRTHQIRVHLSSVSKPVLGDPLYGSERVNRRYGIQRQMLHAHRLRFIHPVSGTELSLEAPIPLEMKNIIYNEKLLSQGTNIPR
jgi:23S rRNA pseudouridine1911/1915/1917 synthase